MEGWVYKIRNKINNKIYVGQTYFLKRRFKEHQNNKYHNPHFRYAMNYYGSDNFEYSILHKIVCENKQMLKRILNHLERFWIFAYQSYIPEKGYNANFGGDGNVGMKFSQESRKKMSISAASGIHLGNKNGMAKAVLQYDLNGKLINEWESIADAERITGIKTTAICNNLKNYSKSSGGYVWKYKNENYK